MSEPLRADGASVQPTLSVALCTYNGARYVGRQLESIARQTRLPDELVVCDDRSADGTVELVREFAARAPFPVRLHVHETNQGSTRNFAAAIEMCRGDLIALSDQDDVWLPEKLERSVELLRHRPEAGAVFTDARVVDDELQDMGYSLWEAAGFSPVLRRQLQQDGAVPVLLRNQAVTGATLVFRASFRQLVLPIPPSVVHDGWIALLIATQAPLIALAEPLMLYRQHASNQIGIRQVGRLDRIRRRRAAGVPTFLLVARDRYELAMERLGGEWPLNQATAAQLNAAARHLSARTSLPRAPHRRLPILLRELVTGRYFRYSNGLYSAAEDLLRR